MTMESFQSTHANNAGHLYTQFYPLSKNQFFAKGIYPFKHENETIEGLAMRTVSHEIMQACEHRERFDPATCVESLKLSGYRITLEVEGNDHRTYGVRQEHRISLALFGAMVSIFQVSFLSGDTWFHAGRLSLHRPTEIGLSGRDSDEKLLGCIAAQSTLCYLEG